ncbi:Cation/H(+) antiporter like [Quillaja saponaria]|uniref:Cation/H(+) antiporter like n=1 Tax=Quillaja saponaria TaxID=32244 RepID=A0AAD7LT82_QUISA|nr:Cation/H(+) antiporter like [Quillaja saponaria]
MALPTALAIVLKNYIPLEANLLSALPYIVSSQSITAFPVIAVLLTELRILNTDIGRLSIAAAAFGDIIGVSLTAIGFSVLENKNGSAQTSVLILLSIIALLIGIIYILRPIILWMRNSTLEGKPVKDLYIFSIFVFVLVTGFLSEVIGQHYVLGPLVLGLVVPDGPPIGAALVTKLDAFVMGFFYPTYLAVSGLQTNVFEINFQVLWVVCVIILLGFLLQLAAVMLPARYYKMPMKDSFVLALIMNAKGVAELVLYNLWKGSESIPTIINILEVSYASHESTVAVTALFLEELVGRAGPVLVAHQPHHHSQTDTINSSNQIVNALKQYEHHNEGYASVQSFTSMTVYETMHDDVCQIAVNRRATIVIVPFHRKFGIDGGIESLNRAVQDMNIRILEKAPCSVGILIDRGILNGSRSILTSLSTYHVVVLYIGGADDAEALAYGARMAKHERVDLTVVRFLLFGSENTADRKRDRRQHPDRCLFEGLEQWSECPEPVVVGDMLASQDFGIKASVLVMQQQRIRGKLVNHNKHAIPNERDQLVHDVPFDDLPRGSWSISVDR